jgi:uncharacterized protein YyaL (SSP411 family)
MKRNTSPEWSYREPAEIREQGNHLRDEPSLYLRQHAFNPLEWYPWGEEALSRARTEGKPIFLSIGYASCHWCHVMEHEVFEDDEVAALLNRHFVSIKVDREERPDLDSVYLAAVHAITGRGGWPLSVFLTPELRPFFGGTYFPRPQFYELVRRIQLVFQESHGEIEQQAARLARHVTTLPRRAEETEAALIGEEGIAHAAAQAPANFDVRFGGFGGQQKFPTPVRWQFLLHHYRKTGNRQFLNMLRLTLEAMASGGIYDHVGGGFHRYTVDQTWTVPHFEKMLYDNAQLASLYLEAAAVTGRSDFLAVGKDVLDFLLQDMRTPEGAFAGSIDADSDGGEGSYYVWSQADLVQATGAEVGPLLAELLGVEEMGNFEGDRSVLTRRRDPGELAQERGLDPAEVSRLFAEQRVALRAHRDERPAPPVDRKIITAWNGLALTALAAGYATTGMSIYRQAAEQAADYLWRVHHRGEGRLHRSSYEGQAGHEGVLDDYAFLACGLLDLFQVTGESDHLARAVAVLDRARADFARKEGGFYLTAEGAEAPLGRRLEFLDSVIPSGNAGMLRAMIQAAALNRREEYRQDVQRALVAFAPFLERIGLEMAGWVDAAQLFAGPLREVVIAGDPGDDASLNLAATALRLLPASAVIVRVPAAGPSRRLVELAPTVEGKSARDGKATAWVCEDGLCQEPTSDPERLRELMLEGWEH